MPELRKRPPPKEAPAPPPPAKKRGSASKSKATAAGSSSITSRAKAAATKVKEAITSPVTEDSKAPTESGAAVEKGETGLIPETAGTAPSTTTVPAEGEEARPPTSDALENPPEKGNIDTTSAAATPADAAALPLSEASIGKAVIISNLPVTTLETHTGRTISLAELFSGSGKGTIIFTYPRASTPGCTTQVCLFRDNHETFTGPSHGYTIYGLSTDSVKANANFATKQKVQYELICDPDAVLTKAIGMAKGGKSTARGVVVIDGEGKVRVWVQAGPARTVEVVKEFLG